MEAVTERVNSASWREKKYGTFDHPNVRSNFRLVGARTQVLCKPTRYYNGGSPGYNIYSQNGAPNDIFDTALFQTETDSMDHCLVPDSQLSCTVKQNPLIKQESYANPIICARQDEHALSVPTQSVVKRDLGAPANCVKSEKLSPTTSPGLATDLENFQDLTEWCHRTPKTPIMSFQSETDELNTPIVELDQFLFTIPTTIENTKDDCYSLLNFTPENESPDVFTTGIDIQSNKFSVMDNEPIFGTDNIFLKNVEECQYSNNVFINDNGGGEDVLKTNTFTLMDSYNLNNTTEYSEHFCNTISEFKQQKPSVSLIENTFMHTQTSTGLTSHENTEEVFTINPDNDVIGTQFTNPADAIVMQVFNTANYPQNVITDNSKKLLRLDFTNLLMEKTTSDTISTPDVINTALELENGFNLVNFINNADIVAKELHPSTDNSKDDIDQSSSTSNDNINDPSYSSCETSDDEDYEPPWKKRNAKVQKHAAKRTTAKTVDFSSVLSVSSKRDSYDSELSNTSMMEPVKTVRRGRPPKRHVSVSSESNADTEVSKYRELRDKNNEASRRSRLNRKLKENELETEADGLDVKNRKLKVRVEELEKLVNTMRTNLMQMMLIKK